MIRHPQSWTTHPWIFEISRVHIWCQNVIFYIPSNLFEYRTLLSLSIPHRFRIDKMHFLKSNTDRHFAPATNAKISLRVGIGNSSLIIALFAHFMFTQSLNPPDGLTTTTNGETHFDGSLTRSIMSSFSNSISISFVFAHRSLIWLQSFAFFLCSTFQ